jgi:hypothetical protein
MRQYPGCAERRAAIRPIHGSQLLNPNRLMACLSLRDRRRRPLSHPTVTEGHSGPFSLGQSTSPDFLPVLYPP